MSQDIYLVEDFMSRPVRLAEASIFLNQVANVTAYFAEARTASRHEVI